MYFVAIKMSRRQGNGSARRKAVLRLQTPTRRHADTFLLAASLTKRRRLNLIAVFD